LLSRIQEIEEEKEQIQSENNLLSQQLAEAKMNSLSGVNSLREELSSTHHIMEQMKIDHSSILRSLQNKIMNLENENNSLNHHLGDNQKELMKLNNYILTLEQQQDDNDNGGDGRGGGNRKYERGGEEEEEREDQREGEKVLRSASKRDRSGAGGGGGGSAGGNDNYLSREVYSLNKEIIQLSSSWEKEKEKVAELETLNKTLEKEKNYLMINKENECKHYQEQLNKATEKIKSLEKTIQSIRDEQQQQKEESSSSSSLSSPGKNNYQQLLDSVNEYKGQIDHLSKMLLKKQSDVMELQTERTALKSRVQDLQSRLVLSFCVCICLLTSSTFSSLVI
jgi:chromosome segregation ATPase